MVDRFTRLDKHSLDAYNESELLQEKIENYRERHGFYPERVLADKIYRNRKNIDFCKKHSIQLSGPALGRPKKDAIVDKKQEYADICERVEVKKSLALPNENLEWGCLEPICKRYLKQW